MANLKLTREKELELILKAKRGDRVAMGKLILSLKRHLEFWAAEAARRTGLDFDDCYQQICLAVMDSVERFDPSRGMRLSTVVSFRKKPWLRKTDYHGHRYVAILDAPAHRDSTETRLDSLASPAPSIEAILSEEDDLWERGTGLRQELKKMSPQSRHVIESRHLGEKTVSLEETGRSIGVTRERVRQIEKSALGDLYLNLVRPKRRPRFCLYACGNKLTRQEPMGLCLSCQRIALMFRQSEARA